VTDRIDIRVAVGLARPAGALGEAEEFPLDVDRADPLAIRQAIEACRPQATGNGALRGRQVDLACRLDRAAARMLGEYEQANGLLARSRHAVLRLAKTVAELGGRPVIEPPALAAAIRLRAPVEVMPGLAIYQ
jgi:magnesium chelatase family protein